MDCFVISWFLGLDVKEREVRLGKLFKKKHEYNLLFVIEKKTYIIWLICRVSQVIC